MKKTTTILLLTSTLIFIGCSDTQTDKSPTIEVIKATKPAKEAKTSYTLDEIYNAMCIQCHASDGSGNTEKLTPTMVGQSEADIKNSLIDIEKDKGHIIMEHNRGEILKMGMEYSPQDMAKYMYKRFTK
ncbi:MAG: hypothetical protein U9N33_03030 [Campylobacterota bacterium]|nr:hypothetical protein [Campylobacterota bacterium]